MNAEWSPSMEARDVESRLDHELRDVESGIKTWGEEGSCGE